MTASEFHLRMTGPCAVVPGSHVLAAVSGGADSVALLCLLDEAKDKLGIRLSCAHVEHGIRGGDSLEDMQFVRALCIQKKIPFYVRRVDVPSHAKAHGMGLEDAARVMRRAALEDMAQEAGANDIALAHHAMDQAETVLMHAARGCDVRGLCAMRARNGRVIRPLLEESPQALRVYLQRIGQSWREDATNLDVAYARSRMRHEVLPALEKAYPGAVEALCRLAGAARRDEAHFDQILSGVKVKRRRLVDGVALKKDALSPLDSAVLGRLLAKELKESGFGVQDARAMSLLVSAIYSGEETVVNLTQGAHACVTQGHVCLIRAQEAVCDTLLLLEGETKTPFGTFFVRPAREGETGDGVTSQAMDESMLRGAVVSQRRAGDAMIPFGRKSPVKLKKLMIDAGVERPIRNSLPVIRRKEDPEGILWVVGLRPGEGCRARSGRRMLLEYRSDE